MNKEILFIGGPHHRHTMSIEDHRRSMSMARIPGLDSLHRCSCAPVLAPMQHDTYRRPERYSEFFPENVFLHESINEKQFIQNLIKDYVR